MSKLTKKLMVEKLTDHGVNVPSKLKVADVAVLFASKSKVLAMGNRTGDFWFGTKAGTWAGMVAEAIGTGEVNSTSDIRKKITKKYGFRQTLSRLAAEGIIKFGDNKKRTFELTTKGQELAAIYRSRFNK